MEHVCGFGEVYMTLWNAKEKCSQVESYVDYERIMIKKNEERSIW